MSRVLLLALALALVACQDVFVHVGKARLAEADGVVAAPDGPTVVLPGGAIPKDVHGAVRLAADRDVTYGEVVAAEAAIRAAGGEPVLLVARGRDIRALAPPEPYAQPTLGLETSADMKACVVLPGVKERKCVRQASAKHIDRAFVRELVREAVKATDLTRVDVRVSDEMSWADAVRAIDAARTCCQGTKIDVSIGGGGAQAGVEFK